LLSVERTESKNQSAGGKYHADLKPPLLTATLAKLKAGIIILRRSFIYNPQG